MRRLGKKASRDMNSPFFRIFAASILRDMRTRFGRSYYSYLLAILWPLSHITIIGGASYMTHKYVPIGDDPAIFVVTGIVPFIFCLYPARFMTLTIAQNKPLLQFSIIKPIHLIFARSVLETLSAATVFILFVTMLMIANVDIMPENIYRAALVIAVTIFLALGMGAAGVILGLVHPIVGVTVVVLSITVLYLTSGAFISDALFPENVRDIIWFNPLYHTVSILRSAYYDGFDAEKCSIFYVVFVGGVFWLIYFLGDRVYRGQLLGV